MTIIKEATKEELIKKQMETISKLQGEIKLHLFEISELKKERHKLNEKLSNRKENIKNIRVELMSMKRRNDFTEINKILAMLNGGWEDEY